MILPILISVSVAPTSYFFWSAALTLVAPNVPTPSIARAAERAANRERIAGILISLDLVECVSVFVFRSSSGLLAHSIPGQESRQEKALRKRLAKGVI